MFPVGRVAAWAHPFARPVKVEHRRVSNLRYDGVPRMAIAGKQTYRAARRLRSAVGYSSAPTPTAAVPLRGKKPCRPMIAG